MSLFCKTPIVNPHNSSAYFKIQIPEEGCEEGIIHYIILFRHPEERYQILTYDHDTTPFIDYPLTWKDNNNLAQLSEYIYKLIISNKMYKQDEPIYFTTNFGIKIAKVFTPDLKSCLLDMLFYIQNITVEKSIGPIQK